MSRIPLLAGSYAVWIIAAATAAAASLFAVPGLSGVLGGGLALVMIAIAAIDARRFVIPDELVLAGLLLGLIAAVNQSEPATTALLDSVVRAGALALASLAFRAVYRLIRGREGIGLGDVKLAGVAGAWLSWLAVAVAVDIAAVSALAIVLIRIAGGQRVTRKTPVPFGLFFAPAIWITWLFEALSLHGQLPRFP